MSKPVYITSDSTCDLTPELLERFNIKIVPLHVVLGEETYLDGVEFTPEMIYERYAKDKTLPRTSAVSPQEFTDFFTPLVEAGYEVVFLSISSGLSSTYQNAVIAAQDLPGVYPVDTLKLTTGVGQMLFAACRMRDEGKDAATIAQAMVEMIPRVNVSFVIDTLEYMQKGGRCTGVAAFGANLLNLKPCIEMREGKLEVCKKYRGNIQKVYDKYITERLSSKPVCPDYIFITTSVDPGPELTKHLEEVVRAAVPEVKEVLFTRDGCTVVSYCGPGTLGVLFLEK
ncbi:MAG: DegV family protein [Clostridiales bacterium]|nr:DegV family protein [Clostridiales bacterium]MDY4171661.1 DegV family protein [Evtepia sp.]